MTTTRAAISSRARRRRRTRTASRSATGFRMLSSRPGRSFFPVLGSHGRLTKGFDPAAYGGYCATPRDRASRE